MRYSLLILPQTRTHHEILSEAILRTIPLRLCVQRVKWRFLINQLYVLFYVTENRIL